MNELIKVFLENFLGLFGVTRVAISFQENVVTGTAYWDNESNNDNFQDFLWKRPCSNQEQINRLSSLCSIIKTKKLNSTDKILVSEVELIQMLEFAGWEKKVAEGTISELCNIEIKMIDGRNETDSFFVHF